MLGALVRVVVLLIIVAAIAAFFVGYRFADRDRPADTEYAVGTAGGDVNVSKARETGARIGETVAEGANRAQAVAEDAQLTGKIKAKMALDDQVEALKIDVDTINGIVTLRGRIGNADQRERAVRLARETEGVKQVVDQLTVG